MIRQFRITPSAYHIFLKGSVKKLDWRQEIGQMLGENVMSNENDFVFKVSMCKC